MYNQILYESVSHWKLNVRTIQAKVSSSCELKRVEDWHLTVFLGAPYLPKRFA